MLSADSGAEVEFVETALTGLEFALFSAGLLIFAEAVGLKLEGDVSNGSELFSFILLQCLLTVLRGHVV